VTTDSPLLTLHEAAQRIGGDVDQLDVEGAIDEGRLGYFALTPSTIRVRVVDVDRVGPTIVHDDGSADE